MRQYSQGIRQRLQRHKTAKATAAVAQDSTCKRQQRIQESGGIRQQWYKAAQVENPIYRSQQRE
jgi:hypothetical protein